MSYSSALQTPAMALAAEAGISPSSAWARASAASKRNMASTTAASSNTAIISEVVRKLSKIDTLTGTPGKTSCVVEENGFRFALHPDIPMILPVARAARKQGRAARFRHLVQDARLGQAGVVFQEDGGELVQHQAAREHGHVHQRLARLGRIGLRDAQAEFAVGTARHAAKARDQLLRLERRTVRRPGFDLGVVDRR